MSLIILFILVPITISSVVSYFASAALHRKLAKAKNTKAKLISIIAFMCCFLVILFLVFMLLLYNIRLT